MTIGHLAMLFTGKGGLDDRKWDLVFGSLYNGKHWLLLNFLLYPLFPECNQGYLSSWASYLK